MNILFLSIGGPVSINEPTQYNDILRQFRDNGYNVYIIWANERKLGQETSFIKEYGVYVLRIKTGNLQKVSFLERGISTLLLEPILLNSVKKHLPNISFDLILYPTPPITFAGVIRYLKVRTKAKTYLLLKDIFPQNAIDLGLFKKNGIMAKYFRHREIQLYKISDYIGCMSKANVEFLLTHNPFINKDSVEVCPNCMTPTEIFFDEAIKRKVRAHYNIPLDKIVLIYGGNIGKPQGISFLISCLEKLESFTEVFTVIVGSGTEYIKLQRYFNDKKPTKLKLLQMLPRNEYNVLVNACDVGLIFLDHRFTIPNFPSRLLSYMNAGIPIIAATDKNTDIGKTIVEGKFGYWCESKDVADFIKIISTIITNKTSLPTTGLNGRLFLEKNFSTKDIYKIIEKSIIK